MRQYLSEPGGAKRDTSPIVSATSTRSRLRTFSIWLAIIADGEPANSSPTAMLSPVRTSEPESPPADMLVVTIWSWKRRRGRRRSRRRTVALTATTGRS